jgi:DNA-binding PucR family transcriptional regulator
LNCRGNVTLAAEHLNMHRNTLLYRISKIRELLDTDFEDWNLRRLLLHSIDNVLYNANEPF